MALPNRMLLKSELCEFVGLSYVAILARIRRGEFPRGIVLARRGTIPTKLGWKPDEVQAWIDAQPRQPVASEKDQHMSALGRESVRVKRNAKRPRLRLRPGAL